MKVIGFAVFCVLLVGCSGSDPSVQSAPDAALPENVAAALVSFNAYAEELNKDYEGEEGHSFKLSGEVMETAGGHKFVAYVDIETSPSSGGGVQVKEEHLRKSDAWFYSNIFLLAFFYEDIDKPEEQWFNHIHHSDTFDEITYRFNVNDVLIDATAELPYNDRLSKIILHDPFDKKTYHWPYPEGRPAAGPDHWCFELDCDACSEASSLMTFDAS